MAPRIVLYGATGYTGRLTATALVRRGHTPVLAGRNAAALDRLSAELGELPTQLADAADPATVRALVGAGDVLLTTVGPFQRFGAPAVRAAIDARAHYVDSTGEPEFIRRVFQEWDAPARAVGSTLLTAFGYDYVPGNLAAALALDEAGPDATTVVIGYFTRGGADVSKGTVTSAAQAMLDPGFAWRAGTLHTEPLGHDLLRHSGAGGHERSSISVAGSEHLSLPRLYPNLTDVRVGLGVAGSATKAVWLGGRVTQGLLNVPGLRSTARRAIVATLRGSGGGPSEEHNATSGSLVIAHAYDAGGTELAAVEMAGPSVYGFTASALAWGAEQLLLGRAKDTGALGPVEAFGRGELEDACAAIGLRRV